LIDRSSGVLLHITSLPSAFGIGDLGPEAYRFAEEFLAATGQRVWQVLPLNPTDPDSGNSPYHSASAFAGNPLLISPELLRRDGLLQERDLQPPADLPAGRTDYAAVASWKGRLLDEAWGRFRQRRAGRAAFRAFCDRHAWWLEDYALYLALRRRFGGRSWCEWPAEFRDRDPRALQAARQDCAEAIQREKFLQYAFFRQWHALKDYCNARGVWVMGDVPIYVAYDSADVWSRPEMFKLDASKRPTFLAGVPPDYFSATGQLWGDPVYDWQAIRATGYQWWIRRMEHNLTLCDMVRMDHFRGFCACWEVPAGEATAIRGRWVPGPGEDFFRALLRRRPTAALVAEDLGVITPDVRELMRRLGLPGMKVLLFAFNDDLATNPYVPHNHEPNCVVYTGTHDNDTARGWFENEAGPEVKERLFAYLGRRLAAEEVPWELIRLAMMSVARLCVLPAQDLLGLGSEARMNRPSVAFGNWEWRLDSVGALQEAAGRLRDMTRVYGRAADI